MDKKEVVQNAKNELKGNELAKNRVVDTSLNSNILDSGKFEQLQRAATLFSSSKLVPDAFRGDMPSTFVAMQLAMRMQVDPFMLMQNMYVVHGKPGLEAKFLIAMVNQNGPFMGPIQWRIEKDAKGAIQSCTAYARHAKTDELCECTITREMVQAEGWFDKPGSKWKTIPEQMYKYRSGSWLCNLYCPEVKFGLPTKEEIEDSRPVPVPVQVLSSNADVPKFDVSGPANDAIIDLKTGEIKEEQGFTDILDKPAPEKKVTVVDQTKRTYTLLDLHEMAMDKGMADEEWSGIVVGVGIDPTTNKPATPKKLAALAEIVGKFEGPPMPREPGEEG